MNYAHNNQKLKTIQHNTEQLINTAKTLASKITPTTETVELEIKEKQPALPAQVNN